jgi:hypothetical protein
MRAVTLFGLAALALLLGLGWMLRDLQPGVVSLQLAFTARKFGEIVHGWGAEGLATYRLHLYLDYLLMACYAAFGWLLVQRTQIFVAWSAPARAMAAALLPLAAAFDGFENALHLWLTEVPRFGNAWVYAMAAAAAAAKWLLLVAFALAVALALARRRPAD